MTRKKERITMQLNRDTVERLRTVVYWTPGIRFAQVVEAAIQVAVKKLEKGRRFKRRGKLQVGRPPKVAA